MGEHVELLLQAAEHFFFGFGGLGWGGFSIER